jgi:AhpD family alkylhydroperoxidase
MNTTIDSPAIERAPERSRPLLRGLQAAVGMVPNLAAAMAESPELLKGFLAVREIYANGTFTPAEIQVLSLAAAYENDCAWCMAFHTLMAKNDGVPDAAIESLRAGQTPNEQKLAALSDFARALIRGRGNANGAPLDKLLAAGYTRAQALEAVLGMGFSLMANYAGHLTDPALDAPLHPYAWRRS